jgi:hypothetical protein
MAMEIPAMAPVERGFLGPVEVEVDVEVVLSDGMGMIRSVALRLKTRWDRKNWERS